MLTKSIQGVLVALIVVFSAQTTFSENLSFEHVLDKALRHSYDSRVFREEALAANAAVREAQSSYYPQLAVRFGNDYIHSYTDGTEIVAGSDVVIANQSSYRHSLISSLSYTLYDFGLRSKNVERTLSQVKIAELQGRQTVKELRREVLHVFSAGLKLQKEITVQTDILNRQRDVFRLSQQLQQAGSLGRDQVGNAALDLAETLNRLEDLKLALQNELTSLGFYTGELYRVESHSLANLEVKQIDAHEVDLSLSPEVQIVQQQIAGKTNELDMARAEMLPKLTFSAVHRMFGSDVDQFERSFDDLSSRDATLSVVLEWPIFAGFAGRSKQQRLQHELCSLHLQKQKIEADLQRELTTVQQNYQARQTATLDHQQRFEQIAAVREDASRLADQQVTDQLSFQQRLVELNKQQLQQELWQIDLAASAMDLTFMQEAAQ